MAWVHDTGYAPAYDHTGYPVSVLLDGTETGSSSARTASEVIGWRSACECGWRGMQFYSRSEWPSTSGIVPDGVDGWETGTIAFAEWEPTSPASCQSSPFMTSSVSSPNSRTATPFTPRGAPACRGLSSAGQLG